MRDTSLQAPVDPSTLTVLPPSEIASSALLSWNVMLPIDAQGRPMLRDGAWMVARHDPPGPPEILRLEPVPLRALFRGDHVAPEFGSTVPPEWSSVFACIERPLARFAAASTPCVRDVEFEKLYSELRRRPDGRYQSALYRYAQAVLQLLLLLRPTSAAEFDAVLRRLARSARTFGTSQTSTHYFQLALRPLLDL